MINLNLNVAICKDYDDETKTAIGFLNEIKVENNKSRITFFNMISGYEEGEEKIQFDYGIVCVDGEDNEYTGKGSFLFTLTMKRSSNSEEGKESLKSLGKSGKFQEIVAGEREVRFPCKGFYEVRVYLVTEKNKKMGGKERMKKYAQDNEKPVSTYSFKVI